MFSTILLWTLAWFALGVFLCWAYYAVTRTASRVSADVRLQDAQGCAVTEVVSLTLRARDGQVFTDDPVNFKVIRDFDGRGIHLRLVIAPGSVEAVAPLHLPFTFHAGDTAALQFGDQPLASLSGPKAG